MLTFCPSVSKTNTLALTSLLAISLQQAHKDGICLTLSEGVEVVWGPATTALTQLALKCKRSTSACLITLRSMEELRTKPHVLRLSVIHTR